MTYTSDITKMVQEFLQTLPSGLTVESQEDSQVAILKAAAEFGFGAPFDREQKAINAMLLDKCANVIVCRVAWGFYYDSKLIEAKK